jgi:hypothetical protein
VAACGPANAPEGNAPTNVEQAGDDVVELNSRIDELEAALAAARQQPEPEPGSNYADWVRDNPLRNRMRGMWIDCGLIIANSSAAMNPDADHLRSSAIQIANEAREIEEFWKRIQDHNRDEVTAAMEGDWETASKRWYDVHEACGECHDVLWTMEARGMMPGTVEAWAEKQSPFEGKWSEQVFTSPPGVRKGMQKLRDNMFAAATGIDNEDIESVKQATQIVEKAAKKNLRFWSGIRRNADAIVQKARDKDFDVRNEYENLRGYCIECHEATSDNRGVTPLPWPQPGD